MHLINSIKRSRLFLAGSLAILMSVILTSLSCGNKESKDPSDVVALLDSVKQETPDLALFGLKGRVKSLKDELGDTYKFTESGMLDIDSKFIERDDSNRIVRLTWNDREFNYTWGSDGHVAVCKSADTKSTYRYDDRGYLLSCFTEVDSWEMSIYKYLEFDDHGNWIKRERQWIGLSTGAEEGEDPTYKNIETEEREIKYY